MSSFLNFRRKKPLPPMLSFLKKANRKVDVAIQLLLWNTKYVSPLHIPS